MRHVLALAAAAAIGTAAQAVTFPFPTGNSLLVTSTFSGTVAEGNAQGVQASVAGDYVQGFLNVPQPLTFSNYSFSAPLINYSLSSDAQFDILLNNDVIGNFTITPTVAQNGTVSGSGSFNALTVLGPTTLTVRLANNTDGGLGVGTTGSFTLDVPEPMSWATMTIGFGLVGWSIRRRARPERRLAA